MKNILIIFMVLVVGICSCKKDDETETIDDTNPSTCNGPVCEPSLLTDETAAIIPSDLQGTYNFKYTYAEADSPFTNGTTAKFILTANNELIVEINGEDCYTLKNPAFRTGLSQTNYFFKDDCQKNICYNVSQLNSGGMSEINVQPFEGMGWYGQFVLD